MVGSALLAGVPAFATATHLLPDVPSPFTDTPARRAAMSPLDALRAYRGKVLRQEARQEGGAMPMKAAAGEPEGL